MFLQHVGPQGNLWNAWVAAHWERRLRKQDYSNADVKRSVEFALQHIQSFPFRCLGHLLLGFCRLLRRQADLLDDKAEEVRLRLLTSNRRTLPVVPTLPESALTLSREPQQTHWESMPDPSDFSAELDLLFLPEEQQASLVEGRRHTVSEAAITMPGAPQSPLDSTESGEVRVNAEDEVFGAPSVADQAAMQALRATQVAAQREREAQAAMQAQVAPQKAAHQSATVLPSRVGETGTGDAEIASDSAALPPVQRLLGGRASTDAAQKAYIVPSGALVPSERSSFGGPLEPAWPLSGRPLEPVLSKEPLARQLRFDLLLDLPSPGTDDAPGAFKAAGFSPIVPNQENAIPLVDDVERGTTGTVVDRDSAREQVVEQEDPATSPPNPSIVVAGNGGACFGYEGQAMARPPKRRRRARQWFDHVSEIPKQKYKDASAFTLELPAQYPAHLPHRMPGLPFTTASSEMAPWLAEPLGFAVEIGARLRQMRATNVDPMTPLTQDQSTQSQENGQSGPVAGDQLETASPAALPEKTSIPGGHVSFAQESEHVVSPAPTDVDMSQELDPMPPIHQGSPKKAAIESTHQAMDPSDVPIAPPYSPGPNLPLPSGSGQIARTLHSPPSDTAHLGPPPSSDPTRQLSGAVVLSEPRSQPPEHPPNLEAQNLTQQADGPNLDMHTAAALDHGRPDMPSSPASSQERDGNSMYADNVAEASVHGGNAAPATPALGEVCTFFSWCDSVNASSADAARGFVSLLHKHMKGTIKMMQEDPYGDIAYGRFNEEVFQ